MQRLGFIVATAPIFVACTETTIVAPTEQAPPDGGTPSADAGAPDASGERLEGPSGKLFGVTTSSFAKTNAAGTTVSVGVVIPLQAFTSGPVTHPFQDDLVLEMPSVAKDKTLIHHLRVNWLPGGHGPDPYGEPHFDLHFLRGSVDDIDRIDCRSDKRMPSADVLPPGYGPPELCVGAMGYHSWPGADTGASSWAGSIIMGFWAAKLVFIEPMIPQSTLTAKKSFGFDIAKPRSAGGPATLYPTHLAVTWDEAASSYVFEFDKLEPIDTGG